MKKILKENIYHYTGILRRMVNWISVGILISIFISCKEFIEIDPPKTNLIGETVFQNNDQATAALTGIYATMRGSYASGSIGGISGSMGFSSDDLICYNTTYLPYYENQLTPDVNNLSTLYSAPYQSIFTANSVLEGLSTSAEVIPSVKTQLEGEALFIRAFAYFYLVNIFGEIPLQLTSDYQITSVASKATIAQIYNQIVADLKTAENKLAEVYPSSGRVRPNRSAAEALLARTYLYMRDWENAEKYSSLVIEKTGTYNLVDFNSVFLANSKEAIWQLEPAPNSNALEASFFIPASLTIPPPNVSLRNIFALTAFETGDKRKEAWIRSYTIAGGTYYYPFKYKVRSATIATEYSTVLRLAEQYLIRAEARINRGEIAAGITDVNIVRQRPLPGGGNANSILALPLSLGKVNALLSVEQERKIELFSEWGHRWFDLKRTDRINTVLGLIKPLWQNTDILYPFPQSEISRNKNITQNDGY